MKLEHFIDACKYNDINIKLKFNNEEEKVSILQINNDIYIVAFSDDEIITSIQFISTCIPTEEKNINNIIQHTSMILDLLVKLIKIFDSVDTEGAISILKNLGFFNSDLKDKKFFKNKMYKYLASTSSGLLFFTISEIINN